MMHQAAELNGGLVKSSAPTHITRRAILQSAVAVAAAGAATAHWKPKLGVYCRYSPSNIAFAGQEGFTCVQLAVGGPISPDSTDEQLADVKRSLVARGLTLVALNGGGNHLDPAAQQRFVKIIELAGRLGVSFIGGSSGAIAGQPLDQQVQAIVKAYESQYFPSCEKYKVRILWEPYVNPANIATSPVAFAALLRAFNDSPYVGIQMDPSHLAWQMIDPVEATREFAQYIFNVHLKDTEILWPLVHRGGIQPVDNAKWWRFRLPGSGTIDWKGFFTALADAGYAGGLNIENEDQFYYPSYDGADFTEAFKEGFRVAHAYVRQFVPPGTQK
jgi:sugar phosphate isomerase/epimerase